jgi:hypothetical protein
MPSKTPRRRLRFSGVQGSFWHALWRDLMDRGRLPLLPCLIAFVLTFFVTRTIVRYLRQLSASDAPRKWWQPRNIGHGSVHIHHAVIGVVLVMVSGVTMVTLAVNGGVREFTVAAVFFGIGAALVLDEFARVSVTPGAGA